MKLEVGIRVSGVDWSADEVDAVMVGEFPHVLVSGERPVVLTVVFDESDIVSSVLEFSRELQSSFPELVVHGVDRDLVNVTDIALRVGVSREAARKWSLSEKFPQPFGMLDSSSMAIWAWTEVAQWLLLERSIDLDEELPSIELLTQIENCLMRNPDHTTTQWHQLPKPNPPVVEQSRVSKVATRPRVGPAQRGSFRTDLVCAAYSR